MKDPRVHMRDHEVRAVLEGRQTQFRRLVNPQPIAISGNPSIDQTPTPGYFELFVNEGKYAGWYGGQRWRCPYGAPGDRLWVRETYWAESSRQHECGEVIYRADPDAEKILDPAMTGLSWRPSIFMPRWASRITLEVVNVRVERLHDITPADAIAEGIPPVSLYQLDCESRNPSDGFRSIWQSINGPESWRRNPWVWVVEFRKMKRITP